VTADTADERIPCRCKYCGEAQWVRQGDGWYTCRACWWSNPAVADELLAMLSRLFKNRTIA
jgi:hypothetical protein